MLITSGTSDDYTSSGMPCCHLQRLVDLVGDAVEVRVRHQLALDQAHGAAGGGDRSARFALAVHEVHAQQRRQVDLGRFAQASCVY